MADPMVYQVGAVEDIDGISLPVGVDYDTVRVGNVRLSSSQCEQFSVLFVQAQWHAAAHAAQMVADEVHSGL